MNKPTDSKAEVTGENGPFHSFTEAFEHRFFEGAEQVKVKVTLMRDTWEAILCAVFIATTTSFINKTATCWPP